MSIKKINENIYILCIRWWWWREINKILFDLNYNKSKYIYEFVKKNIGFSNMRWYVVKDNLVSKCMIWVCWI